MDDINIIIQKLSNDESLISYSDIETLKAHQDEVNAILRDNLQKVTENISVYINGEKSKNDYLFPILFLSECKDKEAFPLIIKCFSYNEHNTYVLYDNLVSEDLACILTQTYNGDYKLLEGYIGNKGIDLTCKYQAIMAYFKLMADERVSSFLFQKYIKKILRTIENKNNPNEGDIELYTFLALCISEYHIFELYDEMRKICLSDIFEESTNGDLANYIDDMFMYDDYYKIVNTRKEINFMNRAYIYRMYKFPDDFIYIDDKKPTEESLKRRAKKKEYLQNYVNSSKITKPIGISKNDLCFCGSGKKYKQCCMNIRDEVFHPTRFEDYYDLLIDYPKIEDTIIDALKVEKGLRSLFSDEAIEVDILFYKAMHNRSIPSYIIRNYNQESIDNSLYLLEGLEKVYALMQKVNIKDREEFERKYMIHYLIVDCTNVAIKIIHDERYPEPQFNHRLEEIIFKINRYFN